jgi:hypothetical protein
LFYTEHNDYMRLFHFPTKQSGGKTDGNRIVGFKN